MNSYKFVYKNHQGEVRHSIWSGSSQLLINGTEIKKDDKKNIWISEDGVQYELGREKIFLPSLKANGEKITLLEFKKWEWGLILAPMTLIINGGAIPALLGFVLVNYNISLFSNTSKSRFVKITTSLGLFIIGWVAILILASVL